MHCYSQKDAPKKRQLTFKNTTFDAEFLVFTGKCPITGENNYALIEQSVTIKKFTAYFTEKQVDNNPDSEAFELICEEVGIDDDNDELHQNDALIQQLINHANDNAEDLYEGKFPEHYFND
jgi:hypothetical protein